ncbi:MAG: ATP phosphoribosyltransferase [Aquificota bacterium]|nr:MAG: ATP phosphoribosyltransferase [Aquificota bacterium]
MAESEKILKLGIPKGSLEKATIDLFRQAGWRITVRERSYFPSIDDDEINCVLVRAQEMSRFVEMGVLDAGITGKDWILENNSDVVVLQDLVYSKLTKRPARWVLVVAKDSPINSPEDCRGKKIYTELVNFTKRYFQEKNIPVDVEFSWGATEAKIAEGLADAIVEVTETGSTIRANGLRIVEDLMITYPQLIANKEAWQDPWKREKLSRISLMLKSALNAHGMVGLKMNVPGDKLDEVIKLLPSITAPTVASLYQSDWYSVETIATEKEVRILVPKLQKLGAVGIIEYPLNKVI